MSLAQTYVISNFPVLAPIFQCLVEDSLHIQALEYEILCL